MHHLLSQIGGVVALCPVKKENREKTYDWSASRKDLRLGRRHQGKDLRQVRFTKTKSYGSRAGRLQDKDLRLLIIAATTKGKSYDSSTRACRIKLHRLPVTPYFEPSGEGIPSRVINKDGDLWRVVEFEFS